MTAIKRFEDRSRSLQHQAWLFLVLVVFLMAFGGYVVFTASSLTARDIGSPDFDKRIEKAQEDIQKFSDENNTLSTAIAAERAACGKAYSDLLKRWLYPGAPVSRPINLPSAPSPNAIAQALANEKLPEAGPIDFQLNINECDPAILFRVQGTPSAMRELYDALKSTTVLFDRTRLETSSKRQAVVLEQLRFMNQVRDTIYEAKVKAAAFPNAGSSQSGQSAEGSDILLRLIQTSITRFGVLAVIGFLVSILVSLYRYNIRLAAFYTARADVLRLSGERIPVSDFAVLASALTPHLEFGKSPPPPIGQLTELIKSVKDAK